MARIELNEIAHSYHPNPADESDYALKRIQYVWEDGGAYALLGPSGCGKTTLLNIISGLLIPTRGKVLYDGIDVTGLPPEKRNIAQVFQFPVLYDTMSVFNNLAFPLRNRGVESGEVDRRVREVADILDLTPYLNKRAEGLAADAKQKISLGRGLVRSDVAAILFDEPLTVIDPHLKWNLRRKLKDIHEQLKLTFIYVTHDQVEALTFADKVVVMYEGEIVQIGSPQDLFDNPEHTFVGYFIGSPGMNFLDCTLEGNVARCNGARIPLDDGVAAKGRNAQGKIELGIRPIHLQVSSVAVDGGVPANVKMVEDQGSYRLVNLTLDGKTLRARVPESEPIPEDQAWLVFPLEWTRLFADGRLIK
ncbi:Glycerol ABC transporter, ATP-binding protein GlpT [Olavius algarvensis associated proteobacterium Delta 3]|nr:Glycerol ABC transporter, ATP-binding protein GlpT [Olavius algarvensis associated proteobacterium Delta 3]CAB5167101.1 Glycerol ABC transporter, ATP-binding protein GlpT [Olavius algarvensis associated proteobacterium Delta 3]